MDKRLIFIFTLFVSFFNDGYSKDTIQFISDKKPIIEILINGNKYNMLIDTGSSINILCKEVVKNENMRLRTMYAGDLYSATTKIKARHVDNADININNINIYQFIMFDIESVRESILQSTGIKIAGILGTPAIKELKMVIDLSRGIVTINKNDVAQADN